VKSKEFYKLLVPFVSDYFVANGFNKTKSTVPTWSQSYGEETLYFLLKTGKYPWENYCGGDFTVYSYFRINGDPAPTDGETDMLHIFRYAEDSLKNRILNQNRNVFAKIQKFEVTTLPEAIKDQEWCATLQDMHACAVNTLRRRVDDKQPWVTINKALYYFDEDDIKQWGPIISDLVMAVVDGIEKRNILR